MTRQTREAGQTGQELNNSDKTDRQDISNIAGFMFELQKSNFTVVLFILPAYFLAFQFRKISLTNIWKHLDKHSIDNCILDTVYSIAFCTRRPVQCTHFPRNRANLKKAMRLQNIKMCKHYITTATIDVRLNTEQFSPRRFFYRRNREPMDKGGGGQKKEMGDNLYQSDSTPRPITTTIILIYFSLKRQCHEMNVFLKLSLYAHQFLATVFCGNHFLAVFGIDF